METKTKGEKKNDGQGPGDTVVAEGHSNLPLDKAADCLTASTQITQRTLSGKRASMWPNNSDCRWLLFHNCRINLKTAGKIVTIMLHDMGG